MSLKYLAVDSDTKIANSEAVIWEQGGIIMDRVDDMTSGVQKLMFNDYMYVGINGDAVDFMPLLNVMRGVTVVPILVVTSNFTTEAEVAALDNGADLFARWHNRPEDNMASVLAHVTRKSERNKTSLPPSKVIIYKDLLIAPLQRHVFVKNQKVGLTRHEFDLLHYLIMNYGKALSHRQIFKRIWNNDFEEGRNILWNAINRLREKLKISRNEFEYIETIRDFGYRFPAKTQK